MILPSHFSDRRLLFLFLDLFCVLYGFAVVACVALIESFCIVYRDKAIYLTLLLQVAVFAIFQSLSFNFIPLTLDSVCASVI
jgi:hypothetical protein